MMPRHSLVDAFLLDVYAKFEKQSAVSPHAAVDLAREFDVPSATVRRWLETARTRGLAPRTGQKKGPAPGCCPTCGASPSRQRTR